MANTSEIKVSIRVTSYKQSAYIRKCLDSILCQNVNFRYEIVVGDDCSNDGTKEILEEYQKKYPDLLVVVINEKNLGHASNYINLDSYLRGEYLCEMESDDFWVDPNRLQKQADFLDSHPEYSSVGGNHYCVDVDGKNPRVALMRWQVGKSYSLKDFLRYGYVVHGNSIMYRRSFQTQEEHSNFLKLLSTGTTMVDVPTRFYNYSKGKMYVFPAVWLAHRSADNAPTSFTFQQGTRILEYSYMQRRILDATTEYLGRKYDVSQGKANITSFLILGRLKGNVKIDRMEFKRYMKELPFKTRLLAYERAVQKVLRSKLNKLGRFLHLYVDSQSARNLCK